MDGWNTTFLLGWPIFRGYVIFRECNPLAEKNKKTDWIENSHSICLLTLLAMLAVLIDEIAIWYGSTSHRFFDHGDPHLPSSLACSQNPSPFRWHLYCEVHTVAHLPKTWRNHGHIRKKRSNSSWDGFHLKTGQVEWGDIVTISTGKVDKPPSTVLYVILFWQKKSSLIHSYWTAPWICSLFRPRPAGRLARSRKENSLSV